MVYTSKLSREGQVTTPDQEGVEPFDAEFHAALSVTLDEWNSPEDDEAFREL
jgi:hypothetical protein